VGLDFVGVKMDRVGFWRKSDEKEVHMRLVAPGL